MEPRPRGPTAKREPSPEVWDIWAKKEDMSAVGAALWSAAERAYLGNKLLRPSGYPGRVFTFEQTISSVDTLCA
jgi:hypothetical protein